MGCNPTHWSIIPSFECISPKSAHLAERHITGLETASSPLDHGDHYWGTPYWLNLTDPFQGTKLSL